MAIAIEGYSIVALISRIDEKYSGALSGLSASVPNTTALQDEELWRCSFMAMEDAERFLAQLRSAGLETEKGPDPDVVLVNEFDQSVEPYCEWLNVGRWDKGVIAWLEGTEPKTLVAREGWSPEKGSGLNFADTSNMDNFEFLRLEGTVEVYRDKSTGKEVYTGRTEASLEALFMVASRTISENMINPGQAPVTEDTAKAVLEAIEKLERVAREYSDSWKVHWFIGKGRQALGDLAGSYESFKRAWELDQENEAIPREYSGACLELGKADEAVLVAEKAAALQPDDPETLGNLACGYLVAARLKEAQATIEAALKLAPEDSINQHIQQAIEEVRSGAKPQPKKLSDLT